MNFLKGLLTKKDRSTLKDTTEAELPEETVTPQGLLGVLDRTSQELGRSGVLTQEQILSYSETLNDMKREIGGVFDAKPNQELLKMLDMVFSRSLLQVFRFGQADELDETRETVFEGIRAITATEKERLLATLKLQKLTLQAEMQENRHWLAEYGDEYEQYSKRLSALRSRTDIPIETLDDEFRKLVAAMNQLKAAIETLKVKNNSTEVTVITISQQLRAAQSDMTAEGLRKIRETIDSLKLDVPSGEEIYQTVQELKSQTDRELAAVQSEASMLLRSMDRSEVTLENTAPEETEKNLNTASEPELRPLGKEETQTVLH